MTLQGQNRRQKPLDSLAFGCGSPAGMGPIIGGMLAGASLKLRHPARTPRDREHTTQAVFFTIDRRRGRQLAEVEDLR